jgi:hypothetical protein
MKMKNHLHNLGLVFAGADLSASFLYGRAELDARRVCQEIQAGGSGLA